MTSSGLTTLQSMAQKSLDESIASTLKTFVAYKTALEYFRESTGKYYFSEIKLTFTLWLVLYPPCQ